MQSNTLKAHETRLRLLNSTRIQLGNLLICLTSVSVFQATNHARGQFHFLSQQLGGCLVQQTDFSFCFVLFCNIFLFCKFLQIVSQLRLTLRRSGKCTCRLQSTKSSQKKKEILFFWRKNGMVVVVASAGPNMVQ